MHIQQAGPAASEEFLPRYTAQDNSPPPVYNVNDNNVAATPMNNSNGDLPPILAQHEAPKPPSPAHLARGSRVAVFAQMVLHLSAREERLPTYESVESLDRLSQRPMPPPRCRRKSQWQKYRTAIILYSIVAVLALVGVSLLAIYSNSLETGEGTREGEMMDTRSGVAA
ncbi:hypothetical protein KC343_g18423 [Hortaea werneckii]|nr:hypothetical protein KC352_g36310 [Hortaea werneckii]KAI7555990.1 hypothetical protein KC317_g12569 [Hortaea werneckii]KAI7584914.1 hypothetical protein KC346_g17826 [Hortaea werneckii]KAI7590365.1 hypothetical protein KC343_g18423 [Hortaea werneckii]KAI7618090.1 hypothetical protein KC319_g19187 [Hortaea werneckii]